ncbi:hypothetical protein HZA71_02010 [Candidatus Falkowbacteria bacterium]|nr:hypothetical protein [Candidatus Falkowbacteria bacterium]
MLATHDAHGLVAFVSGVMVAYVHDSRCQRRLKEQRAERGEVVEFKPLSESPGLRQPSTTARHFEVTTTPQKLAQAFVKSSKPH